MKKGRNSISPIVAKQSGGFAIAVDTTGKRKLEAEIKDPNVLNVKREGSKGGITDMLR